ncbi:GlxA family transcriptional regulator [Methylovirgula sp. 4M-Z18]|uniref:GlxA family transcriptional regulator n=1 Tax=Methylovirgula sp. 4M-Z18 TaxID=2293567 RepID=UPI000E2F990D|nr:helix-turn-helix domain-containing protein [Methylovirgula sp. 4M-Z18]RFB80973.1 helix-turn-helix domain-containing protein [Methylovirgula sp. 4M-Z18]
MLKIPRFPPNPRRVEILAFPDVQLLDVAGPLQVFASANMLAKERGEAQPYDPVVVAPEPVVTSSAQLPLVAHPLPVPDAPVDTFIVAGGFGVHRLCAQDEMLRWLRTRAKTARRTASVCTGAFLLGAAGLLDGKPAVTHWRHCAEFAARFPDVRLDPDPIFVRAENIWTSAGVTAGIDLALALVEADLGHARALAVARQLVVFLKRPGGQAQFSAALALQQEAAPFAALHAWIADHLDDDLSIGALACAAKMSERSFMRHYRQMTGETPARGVERIRVESARFMLEQDLAVKRVAARCGFGSEETMRRAFLRLLNVTPAAYRERFAGSNRNARAVPAPV